MQHADQLLCNDVTYQQAVCHFFFFYFPRGAQFLLLWLLDLHKSIPHHTSLEISLESLLSLAIQRCKQNGNYHFQAPWKPQGLHTDKCSQALFVGQNADYSSGPQHFARLSSQKVHFGDPTKLQTCRELCLVIKTFVVGEQYPLQPTVRQDPPDKWKPQTQVNNWNSKHDVDFF